MYLKSILIIFLISHSAMACPDLNGRFSCKKLKPSSSEQSTIEIKQTKELLFLKSDLLADGTMSYNLNAKPSKKTFVTPFKKTIVIESTVTCDPLILKSSESIDDQIHLTHIQREFFKEKSKLYIFSKYIVAGKLIDSTLFECVVK